MTQPLTHRERVLRAVSLKEPDRVPMDLAGHVNSSIHVVAYEKLCKALGVNPARPPVFVSKMMQDVAVADEVLDALDIDVRGVFHGSPLRSCAQELEGGIWIDEWGVTRVKPEGAYYYDLKLPAPLAGDITVQDIAHYPNWPDPDDPGITQGLKDQVKHWRETSDCAIVLNLPSAFVHQTQYLRGFEDWYMDVAGNQKIFEALADAVLEIRLQMARNILREVGDQVDIVMTSDDMGTQQALQFSPRAYRQLFKSRHAKYFECIRSYTSAPLMLHTCGSVYSILNDLLEIGVQILNPVQTRAANMEPERLKREFGNRLAFWGGVDIQEVMPFGTEEDIRREVKHLFETLGEGGGWVLCPSHNLQPEVPPENIIALYRAGKEIARYS